VALLASFYSGEQDVGSFAALRRVRVTGGAIEQAVRAMIEICVLKPAFSNR